MMVRKQMKKSKEQLKYRYEHTSSYSDMDTKGRVYLGKEELDIYDVVNLLNSKHRRIAELESVLKLVHQDLFDRAERNSYGYKVIELSNSVWKQVKEIVKGE
jgi:hypothetical protein